MGDTLDPNTSPLNQQDGAEPELMDWDDPAWAQEWIEEGIEKGRAEGIEKGRAEGIEIGRKKVLNAIRKRLRRQAESRFDPEAVGQLAHCLERVTDLEFLVEIWERLIEGQSCSTLLQGLESRA